MSFSIWHDYGYGIDNYELKRNKSKITKETVNDLIDKCSQTPQELYERWQEDRCVEESTFFDDDGNFSQELFIKNVVNNTTEEKPRDEYICMLIQNAIQNKYNIRLDIIATESEYNTYNFALFLHETYPWYMNKEEKELTEEKLHQIINEFTQIVYKNPVKLSEISIENCG